MSSCLTDGGGTEEAGVVDAGQQVGDEVRGRAPCRTLWAFVRTSVLL